MLIIKNLKFKYPNQKKMVVNDLSFTINSQSITAIIGHNGSGKSTLAKLIMGLLTPTAGTISYNGLLMDKKNVARLRQQMGILFQNPDNQFIGANCRYDIAFGLENECLPPAQIKKKVKIILETSGLINLANKMPAELSGGQKQRVALAGLMALNKELLIFDEATSMLDEYHKQTILQELVRLNKEEKKTILLITHDLNEALLADQVILLKEGQLMAHDVPQVVLNKQDLLIQSNLFTPPLIWLINNLKTLDFTRKEEVLSSLWAFALKK